MRHDEFMDAVRRAAAKFGDRSFPDAAFVVERDAEKDGEGRTLQKFRHLPHHLAAADDPDDDSTVDIPHLRNALARVGQVRPVKEDREAFVRRARGHLETHARELLGKGAKGAVLQ